jgi:glutamate dehydrogenase/leucine dehydrogenase
VVTIVEAARHLGLAMDGATVAIQGFGNAGATAAYLLEDLGARIVAVSDSRGGIHKPTGLDIRAVRAWKAEHGTVVGFPGASPLGNEALLELEVDILAPAALESQITPRNAERIRPRILAELANGPTTPDADVILARNGVLLIPDILCNAGGVTVSYFEWVQDLNRDQWSEPIVNAKLSEIMVRSFAEVLAMSLRENVDMRLAAYLLAVDRVASATALRGLYP